MSWFVAGGFPMVFILLFGLITLLAAVRFALDPVAGRARPVLAYGAAVGFASLAGTALDLAVVGVHAGQAEDTELMARMAIVGASEAMSPIVLGLSVLAATALLLAIGYRRMPVAA